MMKHILVIDDDIHIGNVLEEALNKEGYRVSRAYSGTEALFVLSCTKPDLILLDLMLPGLNGGEILPRLKGSPVIVVSARVEIDNKVDLLLGGAADYVTKPFAMKELRARKMHFKAAHAKRFPGCDEIAAAGAYQRGYAGLHGQFTEDACQQSAEKAAGGSG